MRTNRGTSDLTSTPMTMPVTPPAVSRPMVGLAALICFGIALVRALSVAEPYVDLWVGAAWRIGLVLAALWWVLPSFHEGGFWGKLALVALPVLVLIAFRGRMLLYVLPIAIAVLVIALIIRPKPKRRRYQ